jgi:major type 1 subunit fimbrin (pilin)
MKKCTLPILGALALSLACSSVFAVDGTITINGVITDGTCTLQGGGRLTSGLKDITIDAGPIPKSSIPPPSEVPLITNFQISLRNATGTGPCDEATSQAFKGIHLSVSSPATDLDTEDKTLLVNKAIGAGGASTTNPIFIILGVDNSNMDAIDFSAPWGSQAKSEVFRSGDETYVRYLVGIFSKTGIVDAQYYTATVNYTLMYN